ncbi:hypothetical protein D3C86_1644570 [compost metagenome]
MQLFIIHDQSFALIFQWKNRFVRHPTQHFRIAAIAQHFFHAFPQQLTVWIRDDLTMAIDHKTSNIHIAFRRPSTNLFQHILANIEYSNDPDWTIIRHLINLFSQGKNVDILRVQTIDIRS